MSRFTQPSQDDGSYVLVARMDNAKNLSAILKAVQFREVYKHVLCSVCSLCLGLVTRAGVHVLPQQPGAQGDGGAVQVCPGQRLHPGQPLPAVCIPSGDLARLQDQSDCTDRMSQYIWRQWRARVSHCTEDVLCRIWQPLDTAVSQINSRRKS